MAANQLVQTRIDGTIKAEAAAVLAAMGLTVSDAVRLMLTRVAREHALPFDPLIPNPATVAAMMEARAGNLPSAKSTGELKTAMAQAASVIETIERMVFSRLKAAFVGGAVDNAATLSAMLSRSQNAGPAPFLP